jgi:hypothetical protein
MSSRLTTRRILPGHWRLPSRICALHRTHPNLKMILVSNYQEAQRDAEAAGALPGFGKRELGTPRVLQVLREAVGVEAIK